MDILKLDEMNDELKEEELTLEEMRTLLLWEDLIFLGIVFIIAALAGSLWGLLKLFEQLI